MKIIFTPLLFVLGYVAIHSQITTNGDVKMFVSANTLVYSTDDITINSSSTSKITNNGNIKIQNGTYNNKSTDGYMELTYTDEQNYGQLIINSGKTAAGKIKMNKDIKGSASYAYFGSPFQKYSFLNLWQDLHSSTESHPYNYYCPKSSISEGVGSDGKSFCPRYSKVTIFSWNNNQFRFDPEDGKNGTDYFTPGVYYNVKTTEYPVSSSSALYGIPYVADKATTVPFPELTFDIGNAKKNVYNIKFYTYLSDPFLPELEASYDGKTTNEELRSAGFGSYTLQLMNPYTSNLNLKALTNNYANIVGIGSFGAMTTRAGASSRYATNVLAATVSDSGVLLGDNKLEIIPPMTNFFIKGNSNTAPLDLYNNAYQTFDLSSYAFPTSISVPTTTGKMIASNKSKLSTNNVYQITLQLFNKTGDIFYNDTYVASGSDFDTGTLHKNEVYAVNSDDNRTSIYTLPEAKTGGIDPILENVKLYINVINSNSEKIAIPVGIDVTNRDSSNTFVITSQLIENGKSLAKGMNNFNDPNAQFYFHDKKLGKSILIDSNFKYEFTQKESTKDRFEIFWGKSTDSGSIGEEISTDDTNALDDLTIVYKTDDEYKVRFNKNWKNAEVSVFTVLGQLISSKKNISTESDYLLPIKNVSSSMFIIKITNENGETVVKKIVK